MSDLGFDPSLKKKKKSKKADDASAASPASPTPDMDDMFAGLKKKKKSKKSEGENSAADSTSVDDLASSLDDLGLKKKKKKSVKAAGVSEFEQQLEKAGLDDVAPSAQTEEKEQSIQASLGLPYEFLLSRFFTILKKNNPELAGDRSGPKFKIPPPVCQREGSKKTLFANVQDIASVLQRNPEHLIQFLFAELGTSGSIDGEKRLVLKGKFQPKQMESVLRRYIIEYVTCKTCKSMNTELKRESANRLHFLSCKACGSTRSVSSIKTGFQAQIGRRKRV
ncbi:putative eukaryotic translation initiation factor 2 subunit beta [Clavispora lusitaniae]|uniref:Translation initiation factor IF2/IF5 domain-containing protein n=3 Tax=Clavispora lusitaniae TaxID=36911 RepID=C4XYH0_CLAL4|nr:uncharacterized protein CLUG_00993 [Clavispora lusitaniae ATCC 42720]KAF5212685.1 translation initiation factor eIF-2 beta subunit [Clavispora lusitaniae]EEQ36870.1 hypothetical protein CLUG_00993 [Clavispora lusitaniae ATCC 42720]KAF7584866.1 Eukaryotic translation initiation factor 2 subunit beta [Clavispora lusitaniae]OVF08123.1 putative translation initiation factor eIF2 subunit [Clavispora lusitaniae]QFZ25902.1 putative eukaryotic translation initiation factor 2 subunit beta [Clavispor